VLPEAAIAQRPLEDRASSKLLVLDRRSGSITHLRFRDVSNLLKEGDVLVVNDTRVTARRLLGRRDTGGQAELLLLREAEAGVFEALTRPAKRMRNGARIEGDDWSAVVLGDLGEGRKLVRLHAGGPKVGSIPLPPYIHHAIDDEERYQTVFASSPGSAAAPTAGLHFTPELVEELHSLGVQFARVTLDVGLDTFRSVQAENLDDHKMHGERCAISETAAEVINHAQGRIFAVGTTAVRTLESFAVGPRVVRAGEMSTELFIRPGYRFQIIDGMFTNFHMPGTTMLMMISALAGREKVLYAYSEALAANYRFLSFGDAMLII
jgi:S-adenosylmethionine:tRNA ribosyltransferase-isomerase